jgi:hypothetical protein
MPTSEDELRNACRDLLRIARKYPEAWQNLMHALSEQDMATLRELAEEEDTDAEQ